IPLQKAGRRLRHVQVPRPVRIDQDQQRRQVPHLFTLLSAPRHHAPGPVLFVCPTCITLSAQSNSLLRRFPLRHIFPQPSPPSIKPHPTRSSAHQQGPAEQAERAAKDEASAPPRLALPYTRAAIATASIARAGRAGPSLPVEGHATRQRGETAGRAVR